MAINEVPIDLVLRARDEMSAVLDRVVRETDGLSRSADKAEREVDQAGNEIGQFSQKANTASTASSGFSAKLIAVGNVAADLAMKALAAVGSAVNDIASAMISGNAEFERYTVQFGVLLGGADNAKKRLAELAEFGAKTPFELPEVVRADKILQSFGLHAEDAQKKFGFSGTQIRTIAGDLAAGTGQSFEDMTRYLGMFASGATGEAISRFQELGITTREELGKMGLEFSKSGELTTPTQQAFNVLLTVAQKKFGGMMDAQSKTFEGMVSNLNDWKGQTLRLIGEPIFEVLREKLGVVLEFLNRPETQQAITNFANGIATALSTAITWVETNWPTIQAVITGVFDAIKFGYENVLKPIIDFAIGLFDTLFTNTQEDFGAISDTVTNVMDGIMGIIDSVLGTIWELWEDNGEEIFGYIKETWTSISDIINGVVAIILRVIEIAMPKIKEIVDQYMTAAKIVFEVAWAAIKITVGNALDLIKGIVNAVLKLLNGDVEGALNTIKDTFYGIWNRIYGVVEELIGDVKDIIDEYLKKSNTSIDDILKKTKELVLGIWQGIVDKVTDFMTGVTGIYNTIVGAWEDIKGDAEFWINSLKNRASALFQETRDDIILKMNSIIGAVVGPWENAKATVEGWVLQLKYGVVAIFTDMKDGITGAFNTAIDNIKAAIRSVINFYNSVAPTLGLPLISTDFLGRTAARGGVQGERDVASRSTTFNITAQYGYQDERSLREDVRTLQMLYGGA